MVMPSMFHRQDIQRDRIGGVEYMSTANKSRYYCLSLLDKHHNPNISLEEGMKLLEMCTDELKRRLPIDYKGVRSGHFSV